MNLELSAGYRRKRESRTQGSSSCPCLDRGGGSRPPRVGRCSCAPTNRLEGFGARPVTLDDPPCIDNVFTSRHVPLLTKGVEQSRGATDTARSSPRACWRAQG